MIRLILLASGFGRRFGSNKLLYEIDGKPMYLHTLEKLHRLSLDKIQDQEVQVVVVSQYQEILDKARKLGAIALENTRAEEGIAASVRLGVSLEPLVEPRVPGTCLTPTQFPELSDFFVFFTGDQPYLKESTIRQFIEAFLEQYKSQKSSHLGNIAKFKVSKDQHGKDQHSKEQITKESALTRVYTMASVHTAGEPGNPTIFAGGWKDTLLSLRGDKGGRKIMKQYPDEVFWYEISEMERKDIDQLAEQVN